MRSIIFQRLARGRDKGPVPENMWLNKKLVTNNGPTGLIYVIYHYCDITVLMYVTIIDDTLREHYPTVEY